MFSDDRRDGAQSNVINMNGQKKYEFILAIEEKDCVVPFGMLKSKLKEYVA